ncbi:hypothetical protein NIES4103_70200 (plasmid) [Nostoc sp. NIES-4103]|nr:hypothetical protein NIES4103_70200 [Nostoc sp. NIES-4103]
MCCDICHRPTNALDVETPVECLLVVACQKDFDRHRNWGRGKGMHVLNAFPLPFALSPPISKSQYLRGGLLKHIQIA